MTGIKTAQEQSTWHNTSGHGCHMVSFFWTQKTGNGKYNLVLQGIKLTKQRTVMEEVHTISTI